MKSIKTLFKTRLVAIMRAVRGVRHELKELKTKWEIDIGNMNVRAYESPNVLPCTAIICSWLPRARLQARRSVRKLKPNMKISNANSHTRKTITGEPRKRLLCPNIVDSIATASTYVRDELTMINVSIPTNINAKIMS